MLANALRLIPALALLANHVKSAPVTSNVTHNDFTCRSYTHPNPVVLMHGLGATYYTDINLLEKHLQNQGYCTFSITYGEYGNFTSIGGLKPVAESYPELANFVKEVHWRTRAPKVDLVGHSEGAFQTLYVTKFGGISDIVQRVFAIAPPTHGTNFPGLNNITEVASQVTDPTLAAALKFVGCPACSDLLPNGTAVKKLNEGPIAQEGVSYTILTSKSDELVTPTKTAFLREEGVRNLYVQDFCPTDAVGHIGETYDANVWTLVSNSLQDDLSGPEKCVIGPSESEVGSAS